MSEPKTQCSECGRSILQRTADKRDGLCAPCHGRAELIPPDDFDFPEHFAKRLRLIGLDPDDYRESSWREHKLFNLPHTELFEGFVSQHEEIAARYREWLPRITEFAEACQVEQPIMPDHAFGSIENEQRRIYSMKFDKEPAFLFPHTVAICRLPLVGISAVSKGRRVHDMENAALIFLMPDEFSRWEKICSASESADRWYTEYWWNVDNNPNEKWSRSCQLGDIAGNELVWMVEHGFYWGPISSAFVKELWAWNGESARFVHEVSRFIS